MGLERIRPFPAPPDRAGAAAPALNARFGWSGVRRGATPSSPRPPSASVMRLPPVHTVSANAGFGCIDAQPGGNVGLAAPIPSASPPWIRLDRRPARLRPLASGALSAPATPCPYRQHSRPGFGGIGVRPCFAPLRRGRRTCGPRPPHSISATAPDQARPLSGPAFLPGRDLRRSCARPDPGPRRPGFGRRPHRADAPPQ